MRACVPALAALLCGCSMLGRTGPSRLKAEREAFEAGRHADVVALLTPERVQRLKRRDLREAYAYLAGSYERLGELDKALGVYQIAVRLFPRDLPLLTQLGFLLHRTGLEEQARPLFDRVLAIHPNNAAANLGLAEIDAKLGFLARSADHYEKALDEIERPDVWRGYAEVLLAARDTKTAELAGERSLKLARDPETLLVLAKTRRADGRLPAAFETLDEALATNGWPRADEAKLQKAVWLLEAARFDEAAALAEAALARDQADPLARWVRARVSLKRDRYNQAVRDLEAAASEKKRAPFVASAAEALLKTLGGAK